MTLEKKLPSNIDGEQNLILPKIDIHPIIDTQIEKMIGEIFQVMSFTETQKMQELRNQMMGENIDFDDLYEKYKSEEQKTSNGNMKSQVCVLLVKIFYHAKNGKYHLALQEFDDICDYLDNIPEITDKDFELFQKLYSEIKGNIKTI